nr:60S ribosomal protein L28-2-like [Tanacetum cinerariifolium]
MEGLGEKLGCVEGTKEKLRLSLRSSFHIKYSQPLSGVLGCYIVANNFYRPDLKKAALARLSAVNRSLKVTKSGAKKKNRQASRTYGRK